MLPRYEQIQEPAPDRVPHSPIGATQTAKVGTAALLDLQRLAGNRAVLQVMRDADGPQREYPGPTTPVRPSQTPALGPLEDPDDLDRFRHGDRESGFTAYTSIVVWLAGRKYDNALHKELVRHYAFGKGRTFPLPRAKMEQVIEPGHKALRLFSPSFANLWAAHREVKQQMAAEHGVQQGQTSPVTDELTVTRPIEDRATVDCQYPTLGAFQCRIHGTLTVRWMPNMRDFDIQFAGTMSWFDRWDFDPLVPDESAPPGSAAPGKGGRSEDAERGTRLAHTFLPGTPFDVVSETVAVHQRPNDVGASY